MEGVEEIFEKAGCFKDSEFGNLYHHKDLPFSMYEDKGNLKLMVNFEYRIDQGKIPLTVSNINSLVKAFKPKSPSTRPGD